MEDFANPGVRYRLKPFWFWNGTITEEEIRRQISEMYQQGVGGFFICARQGLQIPYLSERWFSLCRVAVETARQYGMEVWLYDEYPYPSGMAGGEVTLKNPQAKKTALKCTQETVYAGQKVHKVLEFEEILSAELVPYDKDGTLIWNCKTDVRDLIGNIQLTEIYQFSRSEYNQKRFFSYGPKYQLDMVIPQEYSQYCLTIIQKEVIRDFKYYGTFVDGCYTEAIQDFLQLTHEKYQKYLGEFFGNTIRGFFSDEIAMQGIPWSNRLPEQFQKDHGYSILDHIPALYHRTYPECAKIRYDFYQSAHQLFRSSYHKQVSDWCEKNGLLFTTEVPSMRGTTQIYSHVPGGDCCHEKIGKDLSSILDRDFLSYRANPIFISSLAKQRDRDFCLVEAFHSIGWSMTIQDAKWQLDRLAICGINFYNLHAFYYTTDGITKHDAPPSQFYQNPYWKYYRLLTDYSARLSAWVTHTNSETRIAVIDPVTSFWTKLGNMGHIINYVGQDSVEEKQLQDIRTDYADLCKALFFSHIAFDILDPELLPETEIQDGKIRLGRAEYECLILPPVCNLEQAACRALEQFSSQGGYILGMGRLPDEKIEEYDAEGCLCNLFSALSSMAEAYHKQNNPVSCIQNGNIYFWTSPAGLQKSGVCGTLTAFLEKHFPASCQVGCTGESYGKLLSSVRYDEDSKYLFLQNHSKEALKARVQPDPAYGQLYRMDLQDGKEYPIGMCCQNEYFWDLEPFESVLLRMSKTASQPVMASKECPVIKLSLDDEMPLYLETDNMVLLDHFQITLSNETIPSVMPQTFIEQIASLRDKKADLEISRGFGIPPKISLHYPVTVSYQTEFDLETKPDDIRLVMDHKAILGKYKLFLNDCLLPSENIEDHLFWDNSNCFISLAPYLVRGRNRLRIDLVISSDWEGLVDPLYLAGNFSVAEKDEIKVLIPPYPSGVLDDKPVRGYEYYSGTIHFSNIFCIEKNVQNIMLEVFPVGYGCISLTVNGHALGTKAFTPYRFECPAEYLEIGENQVEIAVTNTLSNLFNGQYFDYHSHELRPVELQEL